MQVISRRKTKADVFRYEKPLPLPSQGKIAKVEEWAVFTLTSAANATATANASACESGL